MLSEQMKFPAPCPRRARPTRRVSFAEDVRDYEGLDRPRRRRDDPQQAEAQPRGGGGGGGGGMGSTKWLDTRTNYGAYPPDTAAALRALHSGRSQSPGE